MEKEYQPDQTGKFRETPTLPVDQLLDASERGVLVSHVRKLDQLLEMTPADNQAHAAATLTSISKMVLTLGGRESGSLASEAKGEAYAAALEDVPCWAVQAAANRWYRGECGDRHDYRWMPAPATMRQLAILETARVLSVKRQLLELVNAKPPRVFSEEHMAMMRQRLAKLTGSG